MNTAIKVENLSKQYRLGEYGTGTISHDLNRWWHKIRGKEDPYLKIGDVNDRATKGTSQYAWALRDINFEVQQGEVLGIIGKNGAGKSTLLKILSRVTTPTTGSIKAKGRIASLLEVGTGFNDELTGRENIFLNGAILGMTKAEISSKFDEIVDFSGTERYIDTPVKRYSSGMRVRLAFAVAAHLEPEILIIDEVLAVGDAEFQKKAIGKMQSISKSGGRTVLFVSHNMGTVQQLCTQGLMLKNGQITNFGQIDNVVKSYFESDITDSFDFIGNPLLVNNKPLWFKRIYITDNEGKNTYEFMHDEDIIVNFEIGFNIDPSLSTYSVFCTILDHSQNRVFSSESAIIKSSQVKLKINKKFLVRGNYSIQTFIHVPRVIQIDRAENICSFTIYDRGSHMHNHGEYDYGRVFGDTVWVQ